MSLSTAKALRAEKARIDAQIKRRRQLKAGRERKRDTRRKVLVGALVLMWMERDAGLAQRVYAELDAGLVRDVDRAVFAAQWAPRTARDQDQIHAQP